MVWERRYERRGREPMVALELFRTKSYAFGSAIGLVYFAGFTAIFFVLALFLQTGRQYSALQAGLAITPFALGSAAASALGGRVVHRFGRPLVAVGLFLVASGCSPRTSCSRRVSGSNVGWATALPLLVTGIGSGIVISPNITLTLSQVPVARAGSAGGVLQTGQRIGAAIGIAAVGSLFFNRLASSHGDWEQAVTAALRLCDVIVAVALVVALLDLRFGERKRRAGRRPRPRTAGRTERAVTAVHRSSAGRPRDRRASYDRSAEATRTGMGDLYGGTPPAPRRCAASRRRRAWPDQCSTPAAARAA